MRILIANGLGTQHDEAPDTLRDDVAWEYGGMIDGTPDFIETDPYVQLLGDWNNISIIGNCIVQIK